MPTPPFIPDLTTVLTKPVPPDPSLPVRRLLRLADDGTYHLNLDWSSFSGFLECPRAGKFELLDARTNHRSPALVAGAALHAGLEVYYKNFEAFRQARENNPEESARILREIQTAISHEFFTNPLPDTGDFRSLEYVTETTLKYLAHYVNDPTAPATQPDGTPFVEFGFEMPMAFYESVFLPPGYDYGIDVPVNTAINIQVNWTGVIDAVMNHHGELWLWDHKTSSIKDQNFFDGFQTSIQSRGYVAAMRRILPSLKGFMLNAILWRKPTKSGTSFETHRQFFPYEDWQIVEWEETMLRNIDEFMHHLTSNQWQARETACVKKWGKCPYFDVCTSNPAYRQAVLDSGAYANNVWKPV